MDWLTSLNILLGLIISGGYGTTLDSSQHSNLSPNSCPYGIYGNHKEDCICLEHGLWIIKTEFCTEPLFIQAVRQNSTFCISNENHDVQVIQKLLTFERPEVAQVSENYKKMVERFNSHSKSIALEGDVYQDRSKLLTYGADMWTLITVQNVYICLLHPTSKTSHYCTFESLEFSGNPILVQNIIQGCDESVKLELNATSCLPLENNRDCEQIMPKTRSFSKGLKGDGAFSDEDLLSKDNFNNLQNYPEFAPMDIAENKPNRSQSHRGIKSVDSGKLPLPLPFPVPPPPTSAPLLKKVTADVTSLSIVIVSNNGLLNEDEDDARSGPEEIGHKLMREQMDQYVDTVVSQLTGLYDPAATPTLAKDRYPVLKILNHMKMIMQRTCPAVKSEYFELALNSFLKVQLESFHVKEPYIKHSVYGRIVYALKQCFLKARPHVFVKVNSTCAMTGSTSNILDVRSDGSEIVMLPKTPEHVRSFLPSGAILEPLIETVWKMVVNAHSYCFTHFKTYFNDHHALNVAVLPLFNNAIQDIWLKEDGYDVKKRQLYGGMLGNISQVMTDVDNCVSASRYVSQYPWYMSRPMRDSGNQWRKRRRRGLHTLADEMTPSPVFINNGTWLCMFNPDDPVTFLDKPMCVD